jgi:hypothetical protein
MTSRTFMQRNIGYFASTGKQPSTRLVKLALLSHQVRISLPFNPGYAR